MEHQLPLLRFVKATAFNCSESYSFSGNFVTGQARSVGRRVRPVGRRLKPPRCIMLPVSSSVRAESQDTSREQRQRDVVAALKLVLPPETILFRHEDTVPFECDALTAYRTSPLVVVLPETEAQAQATLRLCHHMGVPIV